MEFDFVDKRVERNISDPDSITEGDEITVETTVTEEMVDAFAALTGDDNPFHTDEEAAADSAFDGRIAHGALVNAFISTALANYPGDVIYMSQQSSFVAPVYLDETITARCEVVEAGSDQYRIETTVHGEDGEVITGEATVSIQ